jgi:N-acetyl-gamma-glutamyl-phosphate reductase
VLGSNYCDLGLRVDKRNNRLILLAAIDNLVKGASGQAIQNMNLMLGLEESLGLDIVPLYP